MATSCSSGSTSDGESGYYRNVCFAFRDDERSGAVHDWSILFDISRLLAKIDVHKIQRAQSADE
jgi:hypothetical protein